MTAPMSAPAVTMPTHKQVATAAAGASVLGVLAELAAAFNIPATSHTVQSNLSTGGWVLPAVGILAYILHRFGVSVAWIKTGEQFVQSHLPEIESVVSALDDKVEAKFKEYEATHAQFAADVTKAKADAGAALAKIEAVAGPNVTADAETAVKKEMAKWLAELGERLGQSGINPGIDTAAAVDPAPAAPSPAVPVVDPATAPA